MKTNSFCTLLFVAGFFAAFPLGVFAQNAILYFSPSSGIFSQGQTFWVDVFVDTKGEAVNAVGAYFSYPPDKLDAVGVNITGSPVTFFAEKNAGGGKVEISGGTPTPGFTGRHKIASVGFRVKASGGTAVFLFNPESAVLRDSDNQNILNLAASGKGEYSFQAVQTPPPQPPPQPPSEPSLPNGSSVTQTLSLSDVNVEFPSPTEVVISWKTDAPSDSRVNYGLTSEYSFSFLDGERIQDHRVTLSDLTPSTTYHFQIMSKDAAGRVAKTENQTFTTLAPPQPPQTQAPQPRFPQLPFSPWILLGVFGGIALFGAIFLFVIRKSSSRTQS